MPERQRRDVPQPGTVRHARAVYAMFSDRFADWTGAELRDVIDGRRADDVLDALYPLPDQERRSLPYEPGDPFFEKALAVLLVPVWRVVAWLGDHGWRRR